MDLKREGIKIIEIKFSLKSKETHALYVKPHKVKNSAPEKPAGRTLLVFGVPPYVNEECVKRLFSDCGNIKNVFFQKKPSSGSPPAKSSFHLEECIKGFKVAYVVFEQSSSVTKAIHLDHTEPYILSTKKNAIITGLKRWMTEYNMRIPDPEKLQSEIDTSLEEHDKKVAKEKEEEQEGVPDDDGWIKVTKSKHSNTASWTETVTKKVTKKEKLKNQRKELMNFYAFQIRDSKMQHINELRQKFEEDKKRINAMKASRKFRPY